MAAKTAALSVNIIADAAKAKAGLKEAETAFGKFRGSVDGATGTMGKFKAGSVAALDFVKANAMTFGAAAAAAIGAFAIKSVNAFQDLALSAGKFADTTGLTVDEASRFIEVAGDMGIEAGTVEGALNKLNRAAADGSKEFGNIGAEIVRTSSGAVDVQKTFLNVVDSLDKIEDPAKRAEAATALLGRGWTGMSELIAGGSASLASSLKRVSDAKVIDQEELEKARKFRGALDDLKDKGEDLALSLGESLVPALTDFLGVLVDGVEGLKTVHGWLKINESDFTEVFAAAEKLVKEQEFLNDAWKEGYRALVDAHTPVNKMTTLLEDQKRAVDRAIGSWDDYKKRLNFENEFAALQERTQEFSVYWADAMKKGVTNTVEVQTALRNNKLELMGFAEEVLVTASVADRNRIRIKIDTGEIQTAIQLMNELLRAANVAYAMQGKVQYAAVGGYGGVPVAQQSGVWIDGHYFPPGIDFSKLANGKIVNRPEMAMIGEAGPEAVIPLGRPARAMELMQASGLDMLALGSMRGSGGGGGGSTVININVQAGLVSSPDQVGQQIIEAIKRAERRSGQVFASV
jgi:hypothetical protein